MESRKIGVLGAGQLGRMLQVAAHQLNLNLSFLDAPDTPAKQLNANSTSIPSGHFNSAEDIHRFVHEQHIEILTVEIEHIDTQALSTLPSSVTIYPSIETLARIQDKYLQKIHLTQHQIPVAPFKEVQSISDIDKLAKDEFMYPLMLKSKRLAYDGKGNIVVDNFEKLQSLNLFSTSTGHHEWYVEKWVPFVKELAVMVVRGGDGTLLAYPVVETQQKNNICHLVMAPAQLDGVICEKAKTLALNTVATFSGSGIFGVEMFYLANGDIIVNEVAPRPHNSGHYTIEACETSQFENHLRAICGMPLGSTDMKVPYAVMLNILGDKSGDWSKTLAPCRQAMKVSGATVHLYGKKACKPERKVGHLTVVAKTYLELQRRLDSLTISLPPALPLVSVIMGSDSDLPIMQQAAELLQRAHVPYEMTIVSAHRTPERMVAFAQRAHRRGIHVIIAGAGGAAHLPGMVAALTPLPVIGVPIALKYLDGQDSLLSIVQMP
ncbi:phosphoribosylaminoimidazole carboxylase ade2, partial [Coelomomyces lativittatus]